MEEAEEVVPDPNRQPLGTRQGVSVAEAVELGHSRQRLDDAREQPLIAHGAAVGLLKTLTMRAERLMRINREANC